MDLAVGSSVLVHGFCVLTWFEWRQFLCQNAIFEAQNLSLESFKRTKGVEEIIACRACNDLGIRFECETNVCPRLECHLNSQMVTVWSLERTEMDLERPRKLGQEFTEF